MNRKPEDLPLILTISNFPGDWKDGATSNRILNTQSPHTALAGADFFYGHSALYRQKEKTTMHIMEGFLPAAHALSWGAVSTVCAGFGLRSIAKAVKNKPEIKMLLGVSAAFTFVLSALKLPSLTGSCSHPTGTGLGAVLFGPLAMAPIAAIVLLFQAVLLAHGGLTTLGANVFSMGVVGPLAGYSIYRFSNRAGLPESLNIFLAASLADLATYFTTAAQLALAFPDPAGGFSASLAKFLGIFAITQIPLAITEGLLTVMIYSFIRRHGSDELASLGFNLACGEERL
jgi:cobalt/nickel transport system permease protein